MNSIKILPPALQNQIAAGEVVERPSSVVKELMENSLDAGASMIQVYVEGGGQSLIKVADNGSGMGPDDLPLALTRHATSKISKPEELNLIASFGFRGEALPSIASISQMTIASCRNEHVQGFFLRMIYGKTVDQGPLAMTRGTSVKVENLLANVPARLKFLKTRTTESKKCIEAFVRLCLAEPDVDFELFSESKSLYRFMPGQSLLQRLRLIWPDQVCLGLHEFAGESSDMSVHGLASSPENAQGRPDRLFFYVNKRPVRDRMLVAAVRQAYKGRVLSREYPQGIFFINLPAQAVDVNVHPAKAEVRFRDEKEVFSLMVRSLEACFYKNIYRAPLPEQDQKDHSELVRENKADYHSESMGNLFKRFRAKRSGDISESGAAAEYVQIPSSAEEIKTMSTGGLVYLGQVEKSYLLFMRPDSVLLIVDQHAAHERVMLEKIRTGLSRAVVKRLALPKTIPISPCEAEVLQNIWKQLGKSGFMLEMSRNGQLTVSGVPDFLSAGEAVQTLQNILSQKIQDIEEIYVSMACTSAVKSGSPLTRDEAMGLMEKLLSCENSRFCPHGRPVCVEMGSRDLEKMFKRK